MEKIVKLLEMNYKATIESNFKYVDWGLTTYNKNSLDKEFTAYIGCQKVIGKLTVMFIDSDISIRYSYKNIEENPPDNKKKPNNKDKQSKEK